MVTKMWARTDEIIGERERRDGRGKTVTARIAGSSLRSSGSYAAVLLAEHVMFKDVLVLYNSIT